LALGLGEERVLLLPVFAGLMTVAGLLLAGLAVYVGRRRDTRAGLSLALLLVSVAWWGLAYGVELSVSDLTVKLRWGDLKYVGICTLAPAWLVFVLQYTGRGRLVGKPLLGLLTIEPLLLLGVLAIPATHDLVRFYPDTARGDELPVVATGPVFWMHFAYANLMLLVATSMFVATMLRLSGTYRRMAGVFVAAALLPWVANVLHNFEVGWFAGIDLTPFAFTVTGATLVWGLHREGLVKLSPLARGVIVDTMTDAVFVLDAFGRIADVNPAGAELLNTPRRQLRGFRLSDLLPATFHSNHEDSTRGELTLSEEGDQRTFDLRRQSLADRAGRPAGHLVVLRDITERIVAETRLRDLLVERSRIASTLQASLVPGRLPSIAGTEVATRYHPAGDGSEVGGDFFDIFPLADGCWGVVLGDVSGKGAEAAAVTGLTRYTLRTLADSKHSPSQTLRELNTRLLAATTDECHCTLVYALARPNDAGVELTLSLAGHHPPLVLRGTGCVDSVGRLGMLLGLFERPDLHDSHLTLTPGDLLCMFTDGLVEARNGAELYGTERVAAILQQHGDRPTDDIAEELVTSARRFHGKDLYDDLALLLLRASPDTRLSNQQKRQRPMGQVHPTT
jgi:PAS domain S-box-containing protein